MVIKKIGRGIKRFFGGTGSQAERPQQERQLPPEGRQMPPAGPSRAPRESGLETSAPWDDPREFPSPPVEGVGPSIRRPSADEWQPRLVRDRGSSPIPPPGDYYRRATPEERAAFEAGATSGLRSFDPDRPPEDPIDWGFWDSRGSGSGWGGGRGQPPRGYGQGPDGPEPAGFSRKIFLIAVLAASYSVYRWALEETRSDLEVELSQRERDLGLQKPEELPPPESESGVPQGKTLKAAAPSKSTSGRSIMRLRGSSLFGRGLLRGLVRGFNDGLLLVRSFLSGPDLFVRAVRVVVYPVIRQVSQFILPPFLRSVVSAIFGPFSFLGPLMGNLLGNFAGWLTSFGSYLLIPIYWVGTFVASVTVLKWLFGFIASKFISPEIIEAIVPAWEHFFYVLQGCFDTPPEASVSAVFLEKGMKVLSVTISFGRFCNNVLIFIFPEKDKGKGEGPSIQNQRVRALALISLFGVSIYLILFDHTYISIFVQKTLQAVPSVGEFAASSFGQASLLLGSSVIVQSAGFPLS